MEEKRRLKINPDKLMRSQVYQNQSWDWDRNLVLMLNYIFFSDTLSARRALSSQSGLPRTCLHLPSRPNLPNRHGYFFSNTSLPGFFWRGHPSMLCSSLSRLFSSVFYSVRWPVKNFLQKKFSVAFFLNEKPEEDTSRTGNRAFLANITFARRISLVDLRL